MPRLLALSITVGMFVSSVALGHGGRTDSLGCHNDRQRGGYHCHSGPLVGQSFSSKEEALTALKGNSESPSTSRSTDRGTAQPPRVDPLGNQIVPYNRDLYGGWIDADGDCQNTRQEVLIEESLIPVKLDSRGCRVVSGQWLDAYTGQTLTDPADLDIDHFIPLAEAHRSGASQWSSQRKRAFANDLSHPEALMAVSRSANRSKQDSDPADWLPPNEDVHCEYVQSWVLVKGHWDLTMDEREQSAVDSLLVQCECS